MKYIYVVIIPFLLLSLYGGCSNGGRSNELICSFQEMQDRFSETDCIAEELIMGCNNINCRNSGGLGIGEKEILFSGFRNECTILDCGTMECELLVGGSDFELALISELMIDEMNGLPEGIFILDETETPFDCTFIAVN